MCDPATAAYVAVALFGGYQQNRQAKAQAKNAEDTAAHNARVQENEAIKTRNVGVEEENRQRRITAELLGRQRAQLGARNVSLDTGSALQLQEDTVQLGEADALRVRSNFSDRANSLQQGANITRIEGDNRSGELRAGGKAALTGGVLSAAASGAPVASKWYKANSAAKTVTV